MPLKIMKYAKDEDEIFKIKGDKLFGDDLILILLSIRELLLLLSLTKPFVWQE